jgi:hypothetical protein
MINETYGSLNISSAVKNIYSLLYSNNNLFLFVLQNFIIITSSALNKIFLNYKTIITMINIYLY